MEQNNLNIYAIIPARGGSKGVPRKNIKLYRQKPLIYWTIQQAKNSKFISRTYISTEDVEIQRIAIECGALSPFLRPDEISQDLSVDYEFMDHFVDWCRQNLSLQEQPDLLVQLRPTSPNRTTEIIDDCIQKFLLVYDDYDCIRSISPSTKTPYKMYTFDEDSCAIKPLFSYLPNINEPYNSPRQLLPATYSHNGYVDVIKVSTITDKESVTGDKIYPYFMSNKDLDDIDTEEDWIISERKFIYKDIRHKAKNIILLVIDNDGVLNDGRFNSKAQSSYHIRDINGIKNLIDNEILVAIILSKYTDIPDIDNVDKYYTVDEDKLAIIERIRHKYNLNWEQIAYVGDDVDDIPCIRLCGLSACPKDSNSEVIQICSFISNFNGGNGCIRDICDIILNSSVDVDE